MIASKLFSSTSYFPAKPLDVPFISNALNSDSTSRAREAIRTIIASMTAGIDVSSLFPRVIRWMHTEDLELKKLVYLYVINNARRTPEDAILVVNTLVKDATAHNNPVVRAMALRTMGLLSIDRVMEHLPFPIGACLKDSNVHVQKTAVVAVLKLHEFSPDLAAPLLDTVRALCATSPNPAVVANGLQVLTRVGGRVQLYEGTVENLMRLLADANEWALVPMIDFFARYEPRDKDERQRIFDLVLPRLNHANYAVTLGAVRAILGAYAQDRAVPEVVRESLLSALVGLLSGPCEIEWVGLQCIHRCLAAGVFSWKTVSANNRGVGVFFCKFSDSVFVKEEKVRILCQVAGRDNLAQVVAELRNYVREYAMTTVFRDLVDAVLKNAGRAVETGLLDACVDLLAEFSDDRQLVDSVALGLSRLVPLIKSGDGVGEPCKSKFSRAVSGCLKLIVSAFVLGDLGDLGDGSGGREGDKNGKTALSFYNLMHRFPHTYRNEADPEMAILESDFFNSPSHEAVSYASLQSVVSVHAETGCPTREALVGKLERLRESTDFQSLKDQATIYLNLLAATASSATTYDASQLKSLFASGVFLDESAEDRDADQTILRNIGYASSCLKLTPEEYGGEPHPTFEFKRLGQPTTTTTTTTTTPGGGDGNELDQILGGVPVTAGGSGVGDKADDKQDRMSEGEIKRTIFSTSAGEKDGLRLRVAITTHRAGLGSQGERGGGSEQAHGMFRAELQFEDPMQVLADDKEKKVQLKLSKNKLGVAFDRKKTRLKQGLGATVGLCLGHKNFQAEKDIEAAVKCAGRTLFFKVELEEEDLISRYHCDLADDPSCEKSAKGRVPGVEFDMAEVGRYLEEEVLLDVERNDENNLLAANGTFLNKTFNANITKKQNDVKVTVRMESEKAAEIVKNYFVKLVSRLSKPKDVFDFLLE